MAAATVAIKSPSVPLFQRGELLCKSPTPLWKLIMRHIFWTGHGGRGVLFCQRGRLWTNVFGTNHQVHSSDDRARAAALACGVVAPGLWETELAQSQR